MKINLDSGISRKEETNVENLQEMETTDEDYFRLSENPQLYDESNIIDFMEKAIEIKSESEMKYLLEKAFESRTTRNLFRRESPALMCRAIETGAVSIIGPLVKYGARRHQLNSDGETDITLAIKHKKLGVLKELVKFKHTINSGNVKGYFPLLLAADEEFVDAFQLLIEAGANVNKKIGEIFLETRDKRRWRLKKTESLKGESVAHFLVHKINLKRKSQENVKESLESYIQMLLFILEAKKLCKTATNVDGNTVFNQLIQNKEEAVSVFNKLLQKKFPITFGDPVTSACPLAPNASDLVLQAIEEQIPEPELTRMVSGSTKAMLDHLFVACSYQNTAIVKWLLQRGADPNVSTSEPLNLHQRITVFRCRTPIRAVQMTPLHLCVSWISPSLTRLCNIKDTLKLLIEYGAKVDTTLSSGSTPMGSLLTIIARQDEWDWSEDMAEELRKIVFLLLQAGANPDKCFQKASQTETKLLIGEVKIKIFMPVLMMLLETSTSLGLKSGLTLTEVNKQLSSILQIVPKGFVQQCVNEPCSLVHLSRSTILRRLEGRHLADPRKYLHMFPVPVQDYICLTYLHDQDWYHNHY